MQPEDRARSGARLLPGMLVRLEIVTDRHTRALVAPKRALRREGDRSTIFVVDGNVARAIAVAEGFSDEQGIEVIPQGDAKLSAGMRVVVVGNRDLEDGAEVSLSAETR
jgi:multidrug efflux pump subunit AcrA (membrane-fusion protein)